jgi:hypothetical protein
MAETTLVVYDRGDFVVEIRLNEATLQGLIDNAVESARDDDMVFTAPKAHGQYPFHKRETIAHVIVRTTDRRKGKRG